MDETCNHVGEESMNVSENSKRRWKTIQRPEELLQRVDDVVAAQELGYS